MGFSESGEKIEIYGQRQFFIDEPQQTDDQDGRLFFATTHSFFLTDIRSVHFLIYTALRRRKKSCAASADRIAGILFYFMREGLERKRQYNGQNLALSVFIFSLIPLLFLGIYFYFLFEPTPF
jgi:hypothetical protein